MEKPEIVQPGIPEIPQTDALPGIRTIDLSSG